MAPDTDADADAARGATGPDIRRATDADADAICALNREIQALHAEGLPHLFKPPTPDSFPPERVRSLLGTEGVRMWLACVAGQPAGYLFAETASQGENVLRRPLTYVYVNHVCVAAAHRRHGIGRALIAAAEAWAREEGVDGVQLDVWGFNADAQAFFASLGFGAFTVRMDKRLK
jgi:GNAT superfamily N-acetyltransferase